MASLIRYSHHGLAVRSQSVLKFVALAVKNLVDFKTHPGVELSEGDGFHPAIPD